MYLEWRSRLGKRNVGRPRTDGVTIYAGCLARQKINRSGDY